MPATLIAAPLLAATLAQPAAPTPDQADWLREHAATFDTVEAGAPLDDLAAFGEMVGDARIVSLGEPTHGTREAFQMKHRLLEYLVLEKGFTIFSIEASMPEAYALGDYVRTGEGDATSLIRGMHFWTWTTEEVRDMVEWMRTTNAAGEHAIDFTGFDMQFPEAAMANVASFQREADPDAAREVEAAYARANGAGRGGGMDWTPLTGTFPAQLAAGKQVRFSGMVRTEGVSGYASLWWRADHEQRVVAFDNGQDRAPKGDSDWRRFEVVLDVPAEIDNVNFGMLLSGDGTAWFDDLRIELDGEAVEPEGFDLGFETGGIVGFGAAMPPFEASVVEDGPATGARCLRITKAATPAGATTAAEALEEARAVRERLERRSDELAEATTPARAAWAIQNARIAEQALATRAMARGANRDHDMAQNVRWILQQNPEAKIVLWAHNMHVAEFPMMMGSWLNQWYGEDYIAVGFATGEGKYAARGGAQGALAEHDLHAPPPGSIESFFQAAGLDRAILDLRPAEVERAAWLHEVRPLRSIGAVAMDQQFTPVILPKIFDVLIYIDQTTAARQME